VGNLGEVDSALREVQGLPYLMNPVKIGLSVDPTNGQSVLELVGFLYAK